MTIFGIAGSMGLMLVGFGLYDSIMDIAILQYDQIQHYDAMVINDEDATDSQEKDLLKFQRAEAFAGEFLITGGADVTMVYRKQEIPKALIRQSTEAMDLYYALGMNGDRVSKIYINPSEDGEMNFSLNIYVIERENLIRLIDEAYVHGYTYFVRDILEKQIDQLDIRGYCYERYVYEFD